MFRTLAYAPRLPTSQPELRDVGLSLTSSFLLGPQILYGRADEVLISPRMTLYWAEAAARATCYAAN